MSIPPDKWPAWARCPTCRRHWNLTSHTFGHATRQAADYYRDYHERNCQTADVTAPPPSPAGAEEPESHRSETET